MQEENNILELKNYNVLPNKFADEEKRKGILISEWLLLEKIDKLYLKNELNKGPHLLLEKGFVQMIVTELSNIKDILEQERYIQSS
jgi:predicted Fe-Mo cluster-binding NifX family protein